MLVCNISLRPPRAGITADIAEAVIATDATATGNVVFATLVDDPASVGEIVDAYLGEIMVEAASASDSFDSGILYSGDVAEMMTATDAPTATITAAVANAWNPSDKSANVALSNGNLTAQGTVSGVQSVRAFVPSAAKFYFEVAAGVTVVSGTGIGIATSAANLGAIWTNGLLSAFVSPSNTTGNIFYNSATVVANIGAFAVNDIVCVAVDTTNKRIWFRKNAGIWNNSGTADPATNVGGIDISSVFTGVSAYPMVTFATSSTATRTANFGATSYAFTVPSGFSTAAS